MAVSPRACGKQGITHLCTTNHLLFPAGRLVAWRLGAARFGETTPGPPSGRMACAWSHGMRHGPWDSNGISRPDWAGSAPIEPCLNSYLKSTPDPVKPHRRFLAPRGDADKDKDDADNPLRDLADLREVEPRPRRPQQARRRQDVARPARRHDGNPAASSGGDGEAAAGGASDKEGAAVEEEDEGPEYFHEEAIQQEVLGELSELAHTVEREACHQHVVASDSVEVELPGGAM